MPRAWALSTKRHGKRREVYLAQMDPILHHLIQDTTERMKAARAAGAAPLDLGLATALLGLGDLATELKRDVAVVVPCCFSAPVCTGQRRMETWTTLRC